MSIVFNVAKGAWAGWCRTVGSANAALTVVPMEQASLTGDATMQDYTTLADILAGSSNEQTTMGRKTVTSCTVTVDTTNNRVDCDMDDLTWAAASGNAVGSLLVCYDSDTTTGTDANIVPIASLDFPVTPTGIDITARFGSSGWIRARNPDA